MARDEKRGRRERPNRQRRDDVPAGPTDPEEESPSDETLRRHRPTKEQVRLLRREEIEL